MLEEFKKKGGMVERRLKEVQEKNVQWLRAY